MTDARPSEPVILGSIRGSPRVELLRPGPRMTSGTAMPKPMWVYIVTNRPHGTLYIGVTNDLITRADQHRRHAVTGFTDRYNLERLVHFEAFDAPEPAIRREKQLKRWNRAWKTALIEEANPHWDDLWARIAHP